MPCYDVDKDDVASEIADWSQPPPVQTQEPQILTESDDNEFGL